MTDFIRTDAADTFIAEADARETSTEVMRAIAEQATDYTDAAAIWENGPRHKAQADAIIASATAGGESADDLHWGDLTLSGAAA